MKNIKNILKDTPEYESYSRNEAKLTTEEMQELGINTCKKGCCNKQSNGFQKCCQTKNSGRQANGSQLQYSRVRQTSKPDTAGQG